MLQMCILHLSISIALLRSVPDHSNVSVCTLQATASAQNPYGAARAGFEPQSKDIDSTNVPPRPGFVAILAEVCSKKVEQIFSDEAIKGRKMNVLKKKFDQPTGGRED